MRDLAGLKFGMLLALRRDGADRFGQAIWVCVCDCGVEKRVLGGNLGRTTNSCGCLARDLRKNRIIHGHARGDERSVEFTAWQAMIGRCENPNSEGFDRYGGRGIQVCERWHKFDNFYEDMGDRPSVLHSLDRYPNNNGNYEPENCRWATARDQARNRRSNRIVEFRGRSMSLAEAAEAAGINYFTLKSRLNTGWDESRALTEPVR